MRRPGRGQGGRTLLEMVLFLLIFGVLACALLVRLREVEEDVERLTVDLTIRSMRTGIQLAVGEKMMLGEDARIGELLQASPFDYLGARPEGAWSYDAASRELSYFPRLPQAFAGRQSLRWQLEAVRYANGRAYTLHLVEKNCIQNTPACLP